MTGQPAAVLIASLVTVACGPQPPSSVGPASAPEAGPADQLGPKFLALAEGLERQLLKVEAMQAYDEPDDPAYQAHRAGDAIKAEELVRARVRSQRDVYVDFARRGIHFVRLRIIPEGDQSYISYEWSAYEEAVKLGEVILVAKEQDLPEDVRAELRDALIFDETAALVHHYDDSGRLEGFHVDRNPEAVARRREVFWSAAQAALPFGYAEELLHGQ